MIVELNMLVLILLNIIEINLNKKYHQTNEKHVFKLFNQSNNDNFI